MQTQALKTMISRICNKLYERGYLVATSGNVSVRVNNKILITPSATRKDQIATRSIVESDAKGKIKSRKLKPSTEIKLHLEVYRQRKDVQAVIHAHPAYCTACSLASVNLDKIFLPEMAAYLGMIPTIPYATPGTDKLALAARPLLKKHNALLMERHGCLVLGKNLLEAFNRLEQLEHVAKVAYLTSLKGNIKPLNKSDLNELNRLLSK